MRTIPQLKISRSMIVIAAVVAVAVGTLVAAAWMRSSRDEVYRNADDGYEVRLPAAWRSRQLTLQDGRRIDVFAAPNVAARQASCSIGSITDGAWAGQTQEAINQAIASGALDDKLQSLAGEAATLVSSKHVVQNGLTGVIGIFSKEVMIEGQTMNTRTKMFVSATPGRMRYIHCVAFESRFADVVGQFDQLIASYRLI